MGPTLRPIRNVPQVALLPCLVQVSASSALTKAKKLDRSVSARPLPLTGICLRVYDIHLPHSPWAKAMPNFHYRALSEKGQIVSGSIAAPSLAEVARRIDYLRLVPIDPIVEERSARASSFRFKLELRVRPEDVTVFTLDLALLLKAGARLDRALELLAADADMGRLRPTVAAVRSSVLAGESFADALSQHPLVFPPVYVALVRVGEASGTLEKILQVLANDRSRAETLRRKVTDALRYPAFLLFAASCVLVFFLMFVLPQFGSVLHDFGAKIDPIAGAFLALSEFMNAQKELIGAAAIILLATALLLARHRKFRAAVIIQAVRWPVIRTVATLHQTAIFCRNLDVLLSAGVSLTTSLRIIANMKFLRAFSYWKRSQKYYQIRPM